MPIRLERCTIVVVRNYMLYVLRISTYPSSIVHVPHIDVMRCEHKQDLK